MCGNGVLIIIMLVTSRQAPILLIPNRAFAENQNIITGFTVFAAADGVPGMRNIASSLIGQGILVVVTRTSAFAYPRDHCKFLFSDAGIPRHFL
jgi:hypothetical protein